MTGANHLNETTLAQPPRAMLLGGANSRRRTPDKKPEVDFVEVRKGRLVMRTRTLRAQPFCGPICGPCVSCFGCG